MKKSFRLLALTMLVLMLRYTLMPHQFMAYADACEEVITNSETRINPAPAHQDMEQVYIVEHAEQYLLNQFVMSKYLSSDALAPAPLGIAEPVLRPWKIAALPHRGPPWPTTVHVHIASTHLLI
jgi:hypothetical protein